jgi:hypothetical protein
MTELKRSPSAVLQQAGSQPVAVLNHNKGSPKLHMWPLGVARDVETVAWLAGVDQ